MDDLFMVPKPLQSELQPETTIVVPITASTGEKTNPEAQLSARKQIIHYLAQEHAEM